MKFTMFILDNRTAEIRDQYGERFGTVTAPDIDEVSWDGEVVDERDNDNASLTTLTDSPFNDEEGEDEGDFDGELADRY